MKCFRIDEGGEYFYYAAETEEQALAAYREDIQEDFEGAVIAEVNAEEMAKVTVRMDDETQYLSGAATLKQVFDDECGRWTGGALQLCGSVY